MVAALCSMSTQNFGSPQGEEPWLETAAEVLYQWPPMQTTRTIHHADALAWLKDQPVLDGCSFITSLPDFTEFPSKTLAEWKDWFVGAARLTMERCPPDGVTIFYQRDGKKDGAWVDKAYLCQKAAEAAGLAQLWHKIVCRVPAGQVAFGKPGYSHLLCFAPRLRLEPGQSTADILLTPGKTTWTRGMGVNACLAACRFVREHTPSHTIVDPFCGHGTALAVANKMGLHGVGVELSRKRAERARELELASLDYPGSLR